MNAAEFYIQQKLNERKKAGNHRSLKPQNSLVDFCSNDYLGFAGSTEIAHALDDFLHQNEHPNGSTGSRLLSGNSTFCEIIESDIALFHNAEAGLIFNSGYDANLGLFSSIAQRGDTIITDELIHASIIDGCRLSFANRYTFKHNNLDSLESKLQQARGTCYIAVESIYSMDGDMAPLPQIAILAETYGASLIVDEAHAVGVFGKGLVNELNLCNKVFARIVTFGKALGTHGAIVLGSTILRHYLINFARSFIYTTAPSFSQLAGIKIAYHYLVNLTQQRKKLDDNIAQFKSELMITDKLVRSYSGIQSLIIGGNTLTSKIANNIQDAGLDVRPILSPTVAIGSERLRICLHAFNTEGDITTLTHLLNKTLNDL